MKPQSPQTRRSRLSPAGTIRSTGPRGFCCSAMARMVGPSRATASLICGLPRWLDDEVGLLAAPLLLGRVAVALVALARHLALVRRHGGTLGRRLRGRRLGHLGRLGQRDQADGVRGQGRANHSDLPLTDLLNISDFRELTSGFARAL